MNKYIRVCIIGAGFVGKKHAKAYIEQPNVRLQVICDKDKSSAQKMLNQFHFERIETDWHKAVRSIDVDLVCICVPNYMHYEIAYESIKAGKNVVCEKPLGMNGEESELLTKCAKKENVITSCCYNLIRIPALEYAYKKIQNGDLGKVISFRGCYSNDRLSNPEEPFEWRMKKEYSNGGSLCDLAINVLAISQFLIGDIESVCGMKEIIYKKRLNKDGEDSIVENDDVAQFMCNYKNGAMGFIFSNRVAPGSKQDMKISIQLTKGAINFSLERINEIQIFQKGNSGFEKIISDDLSDWYCIGYEDLRAMDTKKLLNCIKNKESPINDFEFATKIDYVIENVIKSSENNKWINIR